MNEYDSSVEAGRRQLHSSLQGPFSNAKNILMFYGGGERGETIERIIASLRAGEAIQHVYGEPGSGKTMLSLVLSDRLSQRYDTIRYDVPDISPALLLRHLLIELLPQKADLITARQAQEGAAQPIINAALQGLLRTLEQPRLTAMFKPLLLVIDTRKEIDNETHRILEALSQVRVGGRIVMQCVLFQRIDKKAARAAISQAASQNSATQFWLRRLTLAEINEYLQHHMLLFDYNRRNLFTREMAYFIADRSEGVIRSINTLARNAFTIANLEDADKLSMSHLLMAGLPQRSEPPTEPGFLARHRGALVTMLGTCMVGSAALLVMLLR